MINPFDNTREIAIVDDPVSFATQYFLKLAKDAIVKRGLFTVALSGGSTPKALYNQLKNYKDAIDWSKVYIFFSDERSVLPTDSESNFFMAMENGFSEIPVPTTQIFRMKAETNIREHAIEYESLIQKYVPNESFDLILLGMGDDGHTASLFPETSALKEKTRKVVENSVPQKSTVRMTFTFPLIENAQHVLFLATGEGKSEMVKKVLTDRKEKYPAGLVTSSHNKVLWILDKNSGKSL